MFRDFVNACWFAFKWGLLAALVAVVAVGLFYYSRLNDAIRQRVQAKFAVAYPNLRVTVRNAQLVDGQGIEVRGLSISDPRLSGPPAELAYFDELMLCCKTTLPELIEHDPKFTRIIVRRPRIQAVRLNDGAWSVSQLLPLPKFSDKPVDMQIEGGQLIIFDPTRNPPTSYTLHDVNLDIKPIANNSPADHEEFALNGTLVADHMQRIEIAGRMSRADGGIDVQGAVTGIDVSPELLAALPADIVARLKPLSPLRGNVDLGFHLRRDPAQPQPWQFDVSGELTAGRFDDPRLPQLLADVRAKFHADNGGIQIEELSAHNGPTLLRFSGRMDGYQAGSSMMFRGEAQHLLVGRQWEPILPPNLLAQLLKFQPVGEVNINVSKVEFDGVHWKTDATVECLSMQFTYDKFPYRLERGTGTLRLAFDERVQQNRLTLSLAGYAGNQPVSVEGEFLNPGPDFIGGVTIRGDELPFDRNLYEAIAATQPTPSKAIQSLNFQGTFNLLASVWREDPSQQRMNKKLTITLGQQNHCQLCYDKFRYPLTNVTGTLELCNDVWTFQKLKGSNHSGQVRCDGSLTPLADGVYLTLTFDGRDLALDDELRDALPERMQKQWNDLQPKGAINLIEAKVNFTSADKQLSVATTVEPVPDSVSIHPTFFPYRLEKLKGAISFSTDDGLARFQHLKGVHGHTEVSASGFCQHDPNGQWRLHFEDIAADRVHLDTDDELRMALPLRLRSAVNQLRPTGLMNLQGTVDFSGNSTAADSSAPALPGECNVVCQWKNLNIDMAEYGTLHAGVDLQNISGGVVLNGSYDGHRPDGQRLFTTGELNVDSVMWKNFQFTNLQGPLQLNDHQLMIGTPLASPRDNTPARRLAAFCYGGAVKADGIVQLNEVPSFTLRASCENVDLNLFCTLSVPGRQKLKGRIQAGVNVTGTAAGLHTLRGIGEVQLSNADIYELPVMVALLSVLNLKPPTTNAFSNSDFQFRLDGEHVLLNKVQFSGDAISLEGNGEMNLNTDLQLTLHTLPGRSDMQLPIWKTVVGGASEQIMQIQVTGNLADPKMKRELIPTIKKTIESMQTGMQPQNRTLPAEGMRANSPSDPAPLR